MSNEAYRCDIAPELKEGIQSSGSLLTFTHGTRLVGRICNVVLDIDTDMTRS